MPQTDERSGDWPQFEIVRFSVPDRIPYEWAAELLQQGAPKALFGRYEATTELTLVDIPQGGHLVGFGTTGRFGKVCLDPGSRAVCHVTYTPTMSSQLTNGVQRHPRFINASLKQFTASVRAVIDRFPFDSEGVTGGHAYPDRADRWAHEDQLADEWDQAARELSEMLHAIDPAADDLNGFWMTFVADVQMGNFATKYFLGGHND